MSENQMLIHLLLDRFPQMIASLKLLKID